MSVLLGFWVLLAVGQDRPAAPGHWPQWRGPLRDNLSTESGLLQAWPEGGPTLLWRTKEAGDGFPPVSVAGGRIYALGYRDKQEFVTVLDGAGQVVWSQAIGPEAGEYRSMRFLNQRPVTVDDVRLYAFTAAGRLLCLDAGDGRIFWEKDYNRDYGARSASFSFNDAPLVDGDLLICKPGGSQGSVVALDKVSGETAWRSGALRDSTAHAPLIAADIDGVRQYVVLSLDSVAGISAKTGALLWRVERPGRTAVAPTPIYRDGMVFVSSGFNVGGHAFRVSREEGKFKAVPVYESLPLGSHRGGHVLVGEHLYGTDERQLKCFEFKTGKVVWEDRCVGKGSIAYADGRLIVRGERGALALVEATPDGYREKGRFLQPDFSGEPTLSHPVVVGGRLYLRDVESLFCYDLRGTAYREPAPVWPVPRPQPGRPKPGAARFAKTTDAAFVPTPQDVVEKLIELAAVTREDVLYDLGSGDGRILTAAAKAKGCRAVGYEIHPDLVRESRAKAKAAGVESLVTIEEKDLFGADLSGASVVTLYLGAPNNARLLPQLRKLKAGSRIVSHAHLLGEAGPAPDRTLKLVSAEDQEEHTIYLWTTPLREGK